MILAYMSWVLGWGGGDRKTTITLEYICLGEDFAWSPGNGKLLSSMRDGEEFVPTYRAQKDVFSSLNPMSQGSPSAQLGFGL